MEEHREFYERLQSDIEFSNDRIRSYRDRLNGLSEDEPQAYLLRELIEKENERLEARRTILAAYDAVSRRQQDLEKFNRETEKFDQENAGSNAQWVVNTRKWRSETAQTISDDIASLASSEIITEYENSVQEGNDDSREEDPRLRAYIERDELKNRQKVLQESTDRTQDLLTNDRLEARGNLLKQIRSLSPSNRSRTNDMNQSVIRGNEELDNLRTQIRERDQIINEFEQQLRQQLTMQQEQQLEEQRRIEEEAVLEARRQDSLREEQYRQLLQSDIDSNLDLYRNYTGMMYVPENIPSAAIPEGKRLRLRLLREEIVARNNASRSILNAYDLRRDGTLETRLANATSDEERADIEREIADNNELINAFEARMAATNGFIEPFPTTDPVLSDYDAISQYESDLTTLREQQQEYRNRRDAGENIQENGRKAAEVGQQIRELEETMQATQKRIANFEKINGLGKQSEKKENNVSPVVAEPPKNVGQPQVVIPAEYLDKNDYFKDQLQKWTEILKSNILYDLPDISLSGESLFRIENASQFSWYYATCLVSKNPDLVPKPVFFDIDLETAEFYDVNLRTDRTLFWEKSLKWYNEAKKYSIEVLGTDTLPFLVIDSDGLGAIVRGLVEKNGSLDMDVPEFTDFQDFKISLQFTPEKNASPDTQDRKDNLGKIPESELGSPLVETFGTGGTNSGDGQEDAEVLPEAQGNGLPNNIDDFNFLKKKLKELEYKRSDFEIKASFNGTYNELYNNLEYIHTILSIQATAQSIDYCGHLLNYLPSSGDSFDAIPKPTVQFPSSEIEVQMFMNSSPELKSEYWEAVSRYWEQSSKFSSLSTNIDLGNKEIKSTMANAAAASATASSAWTNLYVANLQPSVSTGRGR